MEELSPLCVRIKHAFSLEEIAIIHETKEIGSVSEMKIIPDHKNEIGIEFGDKYISCTLLRVQSDFYGNFDSADVKNHAINPKMITVKICPSLYSIQQQIANIICQMPITRIHPQNVQISSKCHSEYRNFGVEDGYQTNENVDECKISDGLPSISETATKKPMITGHFVTYLDSIFPIYAKPVYDQMHYFCKLIDEQMRWKLLNNGAFKAKCLEYIEYGSNNNLGWHCDMGSLVTIVIMCSDSQEYSGGLFQSKKVVRQLKEGYMDYQTERTDNEEIAEKPCANDYEYQELETIDIPLEIGDCVIFNSDKCNHRVTSVLSGKRISFVMEIVFW